MTAYSTLVDSVFAIDGFLDQLKPAAPQHPEMVLRIRNASADEISGGKVVRDLSMFDLVRAGLLYAADAVDESHRIVQGMTDDTAAYWHGMLHRREGDFDNARYWFRRVGTHPTFADLQAAASAESPLMARQSNWDPYLFTGECEQQRFGGDQDVDELRKLQRIEFRVLFDYVWRKSFA